VKRLALPITIFLLLALVGCVSRRQEGESITEFLRRINQEEADLDREIAAAVTPLPLSAIEAEERRIELTGRETVLTLDERVELALAGSDTIAEQTSRRQVAEAMHRRALSSYWPQVGARIYATVLGAETTFGLPEIVYDIPAIGFEISPSTRNTPNPSFSTPASTLQHGSDRGREAELRALESAKMVLRREIGLDEQNRILKLQTATGQSNAFERASNSSMEHRDLTVETLYGDALIEAKRIQHHHAALQSQIDPDQIIGGAFAALVESTILSIKQQV